jgi:hypothetical protein
VYSLSQPTLEACLSHLDRGQLQVLLQQLAARQPELAELIDESITAMRETSAPPPSAGPSATCQRRTTAAAATSIRRQVRGILNSLDRMRASQAYWYVGGVAESVRELAEQARPTSRLATEEVPSPSLR